MAKGDEYAVDVRDWCSTRLKKLRHEVAGVYKQPTPKALTNFLYWAQSKRVTTTTSGAHEGQPQHEVKAQLRRAKGAIKDTLFLTEVFIEADIAARDCSLEGEVL
jgi:hypothetical protein